MRGQSLGVGALSDHHRSHHDSKRSKRSSSAITSVPSESTMINIDDLPDFLFVEILCRLPCASAVQCKCVSKRWSHLISDPYFVGRFLCVQRDKQKPLISGLVHVYVMNTNCCLTYQNSTTSKHPMLKTSKLSLSFLPCSEPDQLSVVLGTHNDLVLCCATKFDQRDYYICNPYTKHWVALPPTPRVQRFVLVGFICDSCSSTSCEKYRWKVVRIVPSSKAEFHVDVGCHVEIFSSETREWKELFVSTTFPNYMFLGPGVASNGMLYWLLLNGSTFELDALSTPHNTIAKFRVIEPPPSVLERTNTSIFSRGLSVCRGRLRMFLNRHELHIYSLNVWELKEEVDGVKWCLVVDSLNLKHMVFKDDPNLIYIEGDRISVMGFDPDNENILYLHNFDRGVIIMCNFRARTLEIQIATYSPPCFDLPVLVWRTLYNFVLPWWPTPVPKL